MRNEIIWQKWSFKTKEKMVNYLNIDVMLIWSIAWRIELITRVDRFCCRKEKLSDENEKVKIIFQIWNWTDFVLDFTFGKLSSKSEATKSTSATLSRNANIAGYQNHVLEDLSDIIENIAPIIGPTMKPSEKAIPTKAIPLPRLRTSETSVMIAMLSEMLPLLKPPTNRAKTKSRKFDDIAQIKYEHEIPICNWEISWLRRALKCRRNHFHLPNSAL